MIMKTYHLISLTASFAMATLGYLPANAQSAGLYSTVNDFLQQKITYPVDCNNDHDKIKLHDLFGSPVGNVVSNGERHSFRKDSTYGYHTCSNKDFRFYHNETYQIIDTAGFYLYYQCKNVLQASGKGMVKSDLYYFSTSGDSPMYLLTAENLKKAYPANTAFHYLLDAQFKSDRQITAYDGYAKVYKVKRLYLQSI